MITVKCPKCRKLQKYEPRQGRLTKKYKTCVYCGRSFKIHSNEHLSRIVPQKLNIQFQTFHKPEGLTEAKIEAKT